VGRREGGREGGKEGRREGGRGEYLIARTKQRPSSSSSSSPSCMGGKEILFSYLSIQTND